MKHLTRICMSIALFALAFTANANYDIGTTDHFSKVVAQTHVIRINDSLGQYSRFSFEAIDDDVQIEEIIFRFINGQRQTFRIGNVRGYDNFDLRQGDIATVELRRMYELLDIRIRAVSSRVYGTEGALRITASRGSTRPGPGPRPRPPRPRPTPGDRHLSSYDVSCQWNGSNHQPFVYSKDQWVGKTRYGYSQAASCEQSVRFMNYSLICNWTGSNYAPYDGRTNIQIGKRDYGFSNMQRCIQTVRDATEFFVCQWNGSNYQPWYSKTNQGIGKTGYGFKSYEGCAKAVRGSNYQYVCQWDENRQYRIFDGRTNERMYRFGHQTLDQCLREIRRK